MSGCCCQWMRLEAVLFVPYHGQSMGVPEINIFRDLSCCGGCAATASWQPAQSGRRRFCEAARVQCCAMLLMTYVHLRTEQVLCLVGIVSCRRFIPPVAAILVSQRINEQVLVPCVCT